MSVPLMVIVVRWVGSDSSIRYSYFGFGNDPVLFRFGVLPLLAMVPLLGLCVFFSDHREGRLRLLSTCGVPPKYVWLSRQSVLLPLSVLTIPVFLLLAIFLAPGGYSLAQQHYVSYYGTACAAVCGYMVLAVAAGQLCSMFIRSAILAAIFSMLLTGLLTGWCWLMLFWHVNMLWSILPIPAALLLATRLHAADWLLERNGPRTWLRPGLVLLVPTVALLIAVPQYRVNQIPVLGPELSFDEYQGTATPEEKATLDLYRQAIAKYKIGTDQKDDRAMQEAVALIVKASRQKLVHPVEGNSPLYQVLELLPLSAKKEEEKGNLDAALERYLAAIRVSGQMRQCDWRGVEWSYADGCEADIYRRLTSWAARPKQTPERIMAAERQLREATPRLSSIDAEKMQYVVLSRAINGDPSAIDFADKHLSPYRARLRCCGLVCLGNAHRAMRLLNFQTRLALQHEIGFGERVSITTMDDGAFFIVRLAQFRLASQRDSELLNTLRALIGVPRISRDWQEEDVEYWRTTLLESYKAIETARSATHVVLALQAWKLKHGSLPKSLDELVGSYLDRVPTDPYSGRPFRYFRDGLKIPLRGSQPLRELTACSAHGEIAANEPFIWSTGDKLSDCLSGKDNDTVGLYEIRIDVPYVNPRVRHNLYRTASSEYEIWQAGWPFPIP